MRFDKLKYDHVNLTCPGCGAPLEVRAELRNGSLLLGCQKRVAKTRGGCAKRQETWVVERDQVVVRESGDWQAGDRGLDAVVHGD